jgi:4-amino-4-deoxy-L-arabinose transferase-like glycosyltransferase
MLPRLALARLAEPFSPAALALIALAFALPGLAGHDLWKSHDAIGLGIVHEMARSGEFIVPRVAGLLWLNDPPLYHWAAAGFGAALHSLLEFHAAARLASGAFVLLAFSLIYLAARQWGGRDGAGDHTAATAAMLLLLGCVGLMVHAHEAVPELATLAALCGAFASLPRAASDPLAAGVAFGAALGAALLSSHWVPAAALFVAVATAHFACPEWRTRSGVLFIAISSLIAGVMAVLWPLALASRSTGLFEAWWAAVILPQGDFLAKLRYFLGAGSWFAWPAWPLAFWTLWSLRRKWREPRIFVPEFQLPQFLVAAALTLSWVLLMFFTPYSTTRSVARWAAGVVLLWGTFAMLWMPWADFQKSYRSVALQLRSKMPVGAGCVSQRGLGIPQAAALDYHADIRTVPFDIARPQACLLLLVQGHPRHEFDAPGRGWTKLADVGRPGDRSERYRLYRLGK